MNSYELIYATIPNLNKELIDELHETIKSYILSSKGEVKSFNEWGLKKLAYPIKNFYEAPYYFVEFDVLPSKIEELKNLIRLNSATLRFSIVKIERDFSKRKIAKKRFNKQSNTDRPRFGSNDSDNAPKKEE